MSDALTQNMRVTACGSFGDGNAGDEAAPLALADLAAAQGVSLEMQVLSRFPEPRMDEVIGLAPAQRERRRSLAGTDALLVGGGVVEARERAVLFRCHRPLRRAGVRRWSLFAAGIEAGVHYGALRRFQIRRLLAGAERISCRDAHSARILKGIGVRGDAPVVGDVVLWLNPAPAVPPEVAALDRYVAVVLTDRWRGVARWYDYISDQLARVARELDAALVFAPFSTYNADDLDEHAEVARRVRERDAGVQTLVLDSGHDPRTLRAVLGGAALTVGMRLHACVMAYAGRTPAVALAYHPKVQAFMETVGWAHAVVPAQPPAQQSAGAYGYRFEDTGIADASDEARLVTVARTAMASADYAMLPELRERLADEFNRALGVAAANVDTRRQAALAPQPVDGRAVEWGR